MENNEHNEHQNNQSKYRYPYKSKQRKKYKTMILRDVSQFEVNNIVNDADYDKIDLSKVTGIRYDELPDNKGKITFLGQEEFSYETGMSMQMCFEDVFAKEYEDTWMKQFGKNRMDMELNIKNLLDK